MKSNEIIKELENIHSERFLASFHDDTNIIDSPDLKALGRSIKILRYLKAHKNETISVAKILSDCKIEV
ncbi:MAG: hypothetical protein IKZ58_06955 [Selenomonadaceae bacterium]|nr:hypothetical protein [Selenomonadaceae bacterium]